MSKLVRGSSTERFTVRSEPGKGIVVIVDKKTGRILTLKGYGALKDEYVVRKGFDLVKPIAAQAAAKKKTRRTTQSSSRSKRRKG